jgi:hypothetical protein
MANLNQPFNGIASIFPWTETRGTSDSVSFTAGICRFNQTGTYLLITPTDQTAVNNTVTFIAGAVGDWFNGPVTRVLQTGSSVTSTAAVVVHRNV